MVNWHLDSSARRSPSAETGDFFSDPAFRQSKSSSLNRLLQRTDFSVHFWEERHQNNQSRLRLYKKNKNKKYYFSSSVGYGLGATSHRVQTRSRTVQFSADTGNIYKSYQEFGDVQLCGNGSAVLDTLRIVAVYRNCSWIRRDDKIPVEVLKAAKRALWSEDFGVQTDSRWLRTSKSGKVTGGLFSKSFKARTTTAYWVSRFRFNWAQTAASMEEGDFWKDLYPQKMSR